MNKQPIDYDEHADEDLIDLRWFIGLTIASALGIIGIFALILQVWLGLIA